MKKILSFIILVLLLASLCAPPAAAYEKPEHIRIGLYYGTAAKAAFRIDSDCELSIGYYSGREFAKLPIAGSKSVILRKDTYFSSDNMTETEAGSLLATSGPYHIRYASGMSVEQAASKAEELRALGIPAFIASVGGDTQVWSGSFISDTAALTASNGGEVVQSSSGILAIDANTSATLYLLDNSALDLGVRPDFSQPLDEKFTVDGKTSYRGGAGARRIDGGNIRLANIVDLEQYLYSVISQEMSPSWHVEALKAQAVCARNYAITNLGKHEKTYGVDLCSTVCCQAYPGIKSETAQSYPPVDGTRGQLLTYKGEVAQTFYASSAGPKTEDVKNVWGSSIPYLVSVDNPYEDTANVSNGTWTKTLTKARATEIMQSKGYNIGTVTNIEAIEYTPAGRVLKLKVSGTAGEKVFEREQCRLAFSEVTLSQMYTISGGGKPSQSGGGTVSVLDASSASEKNSNEVYVISGDGSVDRVSGSLYVTNGSDTSELSPASQPSEGDADTYVFSGQGWGHGIGMSQYGAKGMAENGFTYDKILTHYFTGTSLSQ